MLDKHIQTYSQHTQKMRITEQYMH